MRIIDLRIGYPDVRYLRPIIIVASATGSGIFKTNCAEGIGRRICRDFDLDVENVLWIEHFPGDEEQMFVAVFTPIYCFEWKAYDIKWRNIHRNELEVIRPFIPEAENVFVHF